MRIMRREFQIRTTGGDGDEEVMCFTDLAEANVAYQKLLESTPLETLECELIEVFDQTTIYSSEEEND